jgi:NitT/TauT family transport system ATP-binding protein
MLRLKTREEAPADLPSGAPLLCIDGVSVRFNSPEDVLSRISLNVAQGEFVTLLGPSGCGKSTLLNLTAGTLRAREGTVSCEGTRVVSINRRVGYVTQEDTMLPWLTLAGNVGLPLAMRRVPKAVVKERVDELLVKFGLDHAATRYPSQLSGGMKKRGLVARAMIYEPRLLLMDEPFAALDAQMRAQLHVDLRRAVLDSGVAVLFVTHDLEEAALLSDRIVVIGGTPGRVIDEVTVGLGRERDPETLRFADEFREVGLALHRALRRAKGEEA